MEQSTTTYHPLIIKEFEFVQRVVRSCETIEQLKVIPIDNSAQGIHTIGDIVLAASNGG